MAFFSSFTTSFPSTPEQLKPLVQRIRTLCAQTRHKMSHLLHDQSSSGRTCARTVVCCVCDGDLVDVFLFAGEGEGEAQGKSFPLQLLGDDEFAQAGGDVVEQLHRCANGTLFRTDTGDSAHPTTLNSTVRKLVTSNVTHMDAS